jgi:hypothetical protein
VSGLEFGGTAPLILDFDIETRRIGFHNGGRFNPDGCEPVVIACAWEGEDPAVFSLGTRWSEKDAKRVLRAFRQYYDAADVVTGHYIRKFDLPILNGACLEFGLDPLPAKVTIDTKSDLLDIAGLSSSQENLSALKSLYESKFHMNDNWWRKVARLTQEGLDLAYDRVYADVIQHQSLRASLAGWFQSPEEWRP